MQRSRLLIGASALAMLASACGSSTKTTTPAAVTTTAPAAGASTTAAAAPASGFKVGLVTDIGKVDDKSFNQAAWEGAQQGAKAVGGTAEYIESATATDYSANIKQLLDKKSNVIITVGFAIGEETAKQAAANPTVKFIGVDQFQATPVANYAGLVFPEDKAGFMAGALAGLLTKTNKIAAVLGTDTVPPVVRYGKGWENGAKFTNPKVTAITTYHPAGDNAFNDPEWGATTAKQALDNGADIVFGAGGKTGNGALAEVAKKAGIYCVGVDIDQWDTVPEAHPCLVTSAEKLITPGVVTLVKQAKDGSMKGGNFTGDAAIAPFHDFDAKIPQDVKDKMKQIVADVTSGKQPTGVS